MFQSAFSEERCSSALRFSFCLLWRANRGDAGCIGRLMSPNGTRFVGVWLTGLCVFTTLFSLSMSVILVRTLIGVDAGVDAVTFVNEKSKVSSTGLFSGFLGPVSVNERSSSIFDSDRESNSGKLSIWMRFSCSFLSFSVFITMSCWMHCNRGVRVIPTEGERGSTGTSARLSSFSALTWSITAKGNKSAKNHQLRRNYGH